MNILTPLVPSTLIVRMKMNELGIPVWMMAVIVVVGVLSLVAEWKGWLEKDK